MEQWSLLMFREKVWEEIEKWVKRWWGEELSAEIIESIGAHRREVMGYWYAPMHRSFIEKLKVKPDISPEKWVEDALLFIKSQGGTARPTLTIRQGELFDKDTVISGFMKEIPSNMVVLLFGLITSPPLCSDPWEDVNLLMQLQQLVHMKRGFPRGFIQMLEARSAISIIDMGLLLPPRSGLRDNANQTEDEVGGGEDRQNVKDRPGQYL